MSMAVHCMQKITNSYISFVTKLVLLLLNLGGFLARIQKEEVAALPTLNTIHICAFTYCFHSDSLMTLTGSNSVGVRFNE